MKAPVPILRFDNISAPVCDRDFREITLIDREAKRTIPIIIRRGDGTLH